MISLLLLLAFVALALARQPTCAVLLCNETAHAAAWLAGAEDEYIVLLESVFGGFSVDGRRIGGCFDKTTILNSMVCLERDDFPPARCYAKFCDFWRHSELFEQADDDDDDNGRGCSPPSTNEHDHKHKKQQRVCRTLQAWAAIGIDKLYAGLDAFDARNFTNATSYACVAEKLLSLVTSRLPPVFDDGSSYRHQVLPAKLAAFDMLSGGGSSNATSNNDTNDLLVGMRTIRSFRRAADAPPGTNHSLIATYVLARVLERSIDETTTEEAQGGITQLLWPVSGSLSRFDKSALPPQTLCAQADQPTNLDAFDAARTLPCLGALDFGAVADEFKRCKSFPSSRIRRYDDLSAASCCSTIVLMADIDDKANGTRFEPRHESLGYVAHYRSSCTFEGITSANNSTSQPTNNGTTPSSNFVCPSNTGAATLNGTCAARTVTGGLCLSATQCEVFVFNSTLNQTSQVICGNSSCSTSVSAPCSCVVSPTCLLDDPASSNVDTTVCVPSNTTSSTNSSSGGSAPSNSVVDPQIEAHVVSRVAAPDLCLDVESVSMPDVPPANNNNSTGNSTTGNTTTFAFGAAATRGWQPPREGVPITLAPGESRCVGGERAGAQCSLESECGAGRTCRIKPGTKLAFCYDRYAWSESEPCIYAGELTECPYGYCYGAADGHDGGAYPLLYAFREGNCGAPERAGAHDDCPAEVMRWFEHPNRDSVQ